MADLKDLLNEFAADKGIPITADDVAAVQEKIRPGIEGMAAVSAIDVGPKTACLIKAAVKLGMCIWKNPDNRRECLDQFLQDAASCYLPG